MYECVGIHRSDVRGLGAELDVVDQRHAPVLQLDALPREEVQADSPVAVRRLEVGGCGCVRCQWRIRILPPLCQNTHNARDTYLSQGGDALAVGEEEPLEVDEELLSVVGGDQPVCTYTQCGCRGLCQRKSGRSVGPHLPTHPRVYTHVLTPNPSRTRLEGASGWRGSGQRRPAGPQSL